MGRHQSENDDSKVELFARTKCLISSQIRLRGPQVRASFGGPSLQTESDASEEPLTLEASENDDSKVELFARTKCLISSQIRLRGPQVRASFGGPSLQTESDDEDVDTSLVPLTPDEHGDGKPGSTNVAAAPTEATNEKRKSEADTDLERPPNRRVATRCRSEATASEAAAQVWSAECQHVGLHRYANPAHDLLRTAAVHGSSTHGEAMCEGSREEQDKGTAPNRKAVKESMARAGSIENRCRLRSHGLEPGEATILR